MDNSQLKPDSHKTALTVATLGPLGTYTHEATYKIFGTRAVYQEERTITDVFQVLPDVDFGVVPQENSIFGSVVETYDALRGMKGFVRGETILEVRHCLLVRKGTQLNAIQRILSHEQALGQCSTFIEEHFPSASLIKMASTAAGAQALLTSPADCAAICSKICATLFEGLEILNEGIQNESANFTRFYIVSNRSAATIPQDETGMALLRVYSAPKSISNITFQLHILDLNVVRVDRRPAIDSIPFHDVYFLEVQEVTPSDLKWVDCLQEAVGRLHKRGLKAEIAGIW
ncbi:Prephenate dehydratase-domain-containing protein [Infundibulicybe gibba]|nr:Prephenate dehydratase-domain-containing protein [Infundibulicybe gibba]